MLALAGPRWLDEPAYLLIGGYRIPIQVLQAHSSGFDPSIEIRCVTKGRGKRVKVIESRG